MDTKQIKEIRAKAFAHWSYDSNQLFKWYIAFTTPKTTITEKEKTEAKKQFDKLKQDKINSIKEWHLIFVWMGMENDTDIWNFRIRTEILNKQWESFFIELWESGGVLRIDHSIDKDQQKRYDRQLKEVSKTEYSKRTDTQHATYEKYSKQPYHRYKTDQAEWFIKDKAPTKQLVLDLVNMLYNTNFESIEIDNHLLTTEDYISIW